VSSKTREHGLREHYSSNMIRIKKAWSTGMNDSNRRERSKILGWSCGRSFHSLAEAYMNVDWPIAVLVLGRSSSLLSLKTLPWR